MQFSSSSSFLQLPSASLSSVPPASSIFFQLQFLLSQLGSSSFLQLHSVQFLQLPPASLSSVQFGSSTAGCSSVHFFDSRMQFSSVDAVQLFDSRMRQDREEREERREREERAPSDPTAWGTHQCYVNIEEKFSRQERPPKFLVPLNNINYPDVTKILAAALR